MPKARAKVKAVAAEPLAAQFRVQAMAIAALVLVAFWNALDASFHFDDWALFNDPFVAGPGLGLGIFRLGQTRPMTYWTFHLNFLAGGADAFGFHLVNVLMHVANSVLLLWIARQHVPSIAAFFAAAVFAVHPIQTEAVTYVFARASMLAAGFALLSFALFLRKRYGWSLATFGLSLLAKEETTALPAFVLLYQLLIRKERLSRPYFAGMFALSALAAVRLFWVLRSTPDPTIGLGVKGITPVTYLLTQARVIWHYLRLLAVPVGQNLDYDFRISDSLLRPLMTAPALLALAAVIFALGWLTLRGRHWAFWALGFFVLIAPTSSIMPQADVIYEHRVYFPLASLVIALGWIPAVRKQAAVTLTVVAMLAAFTIARNRVWATELTLWQDVVSKSPDKARPYIGLSRALAAAGRRDEAQTALKRGLRNDPNNFELHLNLGVLLLQSGDPARALQHFERVRQVRKETPDVWNNIGAARYQLGNRSGAIEAFRRALASDPCFYNSRRNLAMGLAEMGNRDEARATATPPDGCRLPSEQLRDLEMIRAKL